MNKIKRNLVLLLLLALFLVPKSSDALTQIEFDSIVKMLNLSPEKALIIQTLVSDRPSSENTKHLKNTDYGIQMINSKKPSSKMYNEPAAHISKSDKQVKVSYSSRSDTNHCQLSIYNAADSGKITMANNQLPSGTITMALPAGIEGQYHVAQISCYDKQNNITTDDFIYLDIKDKVRNNSSDTVAKSKVKIISPNGGLFGTNMDDPLKIKWTKKGPGVSEVSLVYVGPIDRQASSYSEGTTVVLQKYPESKPNKKGEYNFFPGTNTYDGEWYVQIQIAGTEEFIKSKKTIKISSKG